ncbi:MAG TPA: UPF0149 family protein [Rhodanobacteraceae bacterium]
MPSNTCATWDDAIAKTRLGTTAAELHGSVTGFLCAGWGGRAPELLASLALESEAVDRKAEDDLHALLESAAADIAKRLRSSEPIELMLPDAPLAARANASVDWCRGFLGGLGLTGALADAGQSPETRDLLDKFGKIAAMHLACDEDDAAALDDVLDFIRTGVAHLHATFAPTGHA